MTQLWVRDENQWAIVSLEGGEREVVRFGSWGGGARPVVHPDTQPRIIRLEAPSGPVWILLSRSEHGVSVNGLPLPAGIRVLADRDEIRVGPSEVFYFSAETLAEVVPRPASEHEIVCPRCQQTIDRGTPAVRCPTCGVWHHASDEFGCWNYASTCTMCPHPTAQEAGFRWTPDGL